MAVITISREYGSRGNEIARRICDRLGYRYFDKNLMAQLGAQMGLNPDMVADLPQDKQYQTRSLLERLLTTTPLPNIAGDLDWSWAARTQAEEQTVRMSVQTVESLIRAAHEQGNVVVVGRAGQVVLHNMPDVIHLRVVAPIEQRIERIQQIAALSTDAARELVHRRDQAAGDYIKSFYTVDWTDPLLYTVVINTDKLTPPLAVDLIVKALECLPAAAKPELPSVTA